MELPKLGDTIYTDLVTQPRRLYATLVTEDALAYGQELVAVGRWFILKEADNGNGNEAKEKSY